MDNLPATPSAANGVFGDKGDMHTGEHAEERHRKAPNIGCLQIHIACAGLGTLVQQLWRHIHLSVQETCSKIAIASNPYVLLCHHLPVPTCW